MKYSIGLDIGTTSVGYACVNQNYEILKYQGKWAWGVREFEAAKTAEFRRQKRQMRRRYNRRKKRIQLVQDLFAPYVPVGFFKTKNEKHFWENENHFEQRTLSEVLKTLNKNQRSIPTIYHLRKLLMEDQKKQDIRLIYLAVHNLIKYRGHFLHNGRWSKQNKGLNFLADFSELLTNYCEINDLPLPELDFQATQKIIENPNMTRKDKEKELETLSSKSFTPLWKLLLGLNVDAEKLFLTSANISLYKLEKLKVALGSEELDEVRSSLTEGENVFIDQAYLLYQQLLLKDLLQGYECVAFAKVASYEKYQEDLKGLKVLINETGNEKLYRRFFITPKKAMNEYKKAPKKEHFKALCLLDQYNLKHKASEKEIVVNEMIKLLKKAQIENIEQITQQLKDGDFLNYQKGTHNAAIPNQNSIYEIEKILNNQKKHYQFITDNFIEKVIQIVSFRIPYYIGPLAKENMSEFSWLERNIENGHITPETFNRIIDESTTAEKFIKRMTNKCTYLKEEDVIPKHSLLYEYFVMLNELNAIQIRPLTAASHVKYRLPIEAKKCIIEYGFKKYKVMTHKRLLQVLREHHFEYLIEDSDGPYAIFGTQQENKFSSNLSSYITFQNLFEKQGMVFDEQMIEKLIEWLTIFTEKTIVKKKIKENYANLSDEFIEILCKKQFTGWGKLSRALIDGILLNDGKTVIEKMFDSTLIFREIMSPKNSNLEMLIKQHNKSSEKIKKITYNDIQDLSGSPALKRGIWQAIKIVEELTEIFGEPANIMLEVAREEGKKVRTQSRYKKFESIVKGLGKDEKDLKQYLSSYLKEPESKFRDNRFYLYLLQQGKCAYSGKPLKVENLSYYDVDHIYPQNFVKDDSLDNLVLVEKSRNQEKGGFKMPLEILSPSEGIRMRGVWKSWLDKGFISDKKYMRLCKKTFSEMDRDQFIARQLVETRQIIKNVGVLLEERFSTAKIHLVKAPIVSKFRKILEIPKIRDLNNKHHAIDALLNVYLIEHAIQKYGENIFAFSFKNKERSSVLAKVAQQHKGFFLFNSFLGEKFTGPISKEILPAKKFMEEVYYNLPWQTTKKVGSTDEMFFDETFYSPKGETAIYESGKTKFNFQKGLKAAAIVVVKYTEQKKNKLVECSELLKINVLEEKQWATLSDNEKALKLVKNKYAKKEVLDAIWVTSLPKYQKVLWQNQLFYLASVAEQHLAKQFVLPKNLLSAYLQVDEQVNLTELQNIYEKIANEMFEQYPVYKNNTITNKVQKIKMQITDVESLKKHVGEIFKATYNSAIRSEELGSRLTKPFKVEDIQIVYESITGLKRRKPKALL